MPFAGRSAVAHGFVVALLHVTLSLLALNRAAGAQTVPGAGPAIDAARIKRHIEVLAHDSLGGRNTPSAGLESAAAYIARELSAAGVKPLPGQRALRLPWRYTAKEVDRASRLVANARGASDTLKFGRDFWALSTQQESVTGNVVYAGVAGDTSSLSELRGKIALYSLGEQRAPPVAHALIQAAARSGALAAVILLPGSASNGEFEHTLDQTRLMVHTGEGALVIGVRAGAAEPFLARMGYTVKSLEKLAGPTPLAGVTLTISAPIGGEVSVVPHVIGRIAGADPALADEYVAVTAHFDHIGVGRADAAGDSIFNGADDNASGVAAIIEIAKAIARGGERPRRSILVAAFSGEERGIVGSRDFLESSLVAPERIVAALNLDGVGRMGKRDTVAALGLEYSDLGTTIATANAAHPELRLTVVEDPFHDHHSYLRSDHISFARKGVPSIFFWSSGPHADLHGLDDEIERIDPAATARTASLALFTTRAVASSDRRPRWKAAAYQEIVGKPCRACDTD